MVNNVQTECSFSSWYPQFRKDSLKGTVLPIPDNILDYLEHDAFVMPLEAARMLSSNSEWFDGSPVIQEEVCDHQPTFPDFSREIQDVIDEYGAVFIKTNWSCPSDATWVAPTKTLKCKTLEEVYLLLKSSNRIAKDLHIIKSCPENKDSLPSCLILKQWRDINPCTEFRCFVIDNELIGISQRDISQYHSYNDSEKYNIQSDIKSLFSERIQSRFPLANYSFDVVRYKKDKVKIIDFGGMDESTTKGTLFTYEELLNVIDKPEFRFIGEEIGIQPKPTPHVCVPQEINEFFQSSDKSLLDIIRNEVESQTREFEDTDTET